MTERLLDRHHRLPDGRAVRLRLPHVGDRPGVHDLLGRMGLAAADVEVRRGLRWALGSRWAAVATAWDGRRERIVGVATVDPSDGAPSLLAEDAAVCDLLARALEEHARPRGRRVA